ncbi:MAG: tail fiber protein [Bdellovibrionales bacterium]|nr:tail fiber protein [Bdellovibrionales bacterium]
MGTARKNSRAGVSVVEVIVASLAVTGVAMLAANVSKGVSISNFKVQSEATLSNLRTVVIAINNDPVNWVSTLKSNNTIVKDCLAKVAPYNCPAAESVGTDAILLAEVTGKVVSSVDLYDLNSIQFAGKTGSEIYFDASGLPCVSGTPTTDLKCRFKSTGYMVRAAVMPGSVSFIRKLEQTAQTVTKDVPVMQPLYEKINIGQLWRTSADNAPAVGTIMAYAGDPADALPSGYLLADGSSLAQADHPLLYAAIGNTWGAAGAGQFLLPNLNGQFLRGASGTNPFATAQTSDYVSHEHTASFSATGSMSVGSLTMTVPSQSFGAALTGAAPWFNAGGPYDGHLGFGVANSLTTFPAGAQSAVAAIGAGSATGSITTLNSMVVSPSFVNAGGTETRPSNAAVIFIIKDDDS